MCLLRVFALRRAVDISNLRNLLPSDAPDDIIENAEDIETVGEEISLEE